MKRVLLTVHKFFPEHRAGTEVLTLKVAQELMRRGVSVLVVTANPPDSDARHASGPEIRRYDFESVPVVSFEEPLRLRDYRFDCEHFNPAMAQAFEGVLAEFAPDIVHSFHCQNLSSAVVDVSLRLGVPVVLSTTDFWFVCPVVQLKRPDGAVCRGPAPGALNCLTCYTPRLFPPRPEFNEALERKYPAMGGLASLPAVAAGACRTALYGLYAASKAPAAVAATVSRPRALREAANRTGAIMVPTKLMRDIFIENGIRADLIHHVPFGLDTAPLVPFSNKQPCRDLRVGYIGTIYEHKGVDILVDAFNRLPADAPCLLKIYGDMEQFPEYAGRVRALAGKHGQAGRKILFAGTFPNSELGAVLSEIDVLVVPSRWYENTPLVIQSALATRTPVIATDLGGMSELIRHGENGFLFELNNPASLASLIETLAGDRALLEELRGRIAPERTVADMVDDIERVYCAALAAPLPAVPAASA